MLSCIVVFCTTYALILPALTLEAQTVCGREEHEHTQECYTSVLVCGQEESEGHQHSEDCYDEEGTLICGMEESEGHQHSDACYEQELTCGKEVHVHSKECYRQEEPEEAETELASAEGGEAAVDEDEDSFDAPADTAKESAGIAEPKKLKEIEFARLMSSRSGIYYLPEDAGRDEWTEVKDDVLLDPEQKVLVHIAFELPAERVNATNAETEYALPFLLQLDKEAVEDINQYQYQIFGGTDREAEDLADAGRYEIIEEFDDDGNVTDRMIAVRFSDYTCRTVGGEKLTDGTVTVEPASMEGFFEMTISAGELLTLKKEIGKDGEEYYALKWNEDETLDTHVRFDEEKLAEYLKKKAAEEAEETDESAEDAEEAAEGTALEGETEGLNEKGETVDEASAEDETDAEEAENADDETDVEEAENADDETAAEDSEDAESVSEDTADEDTEDVSASHAANTLEYHAGSFTAAITYDETAGIPEGAVLTAREITGASSMEYQNRASEALGEEWSITGGRYFDLEVRDPQGEKAALQAPVEVRIQYLNSDTIAVGTAVKGVQFAADGAAAVDVQTRGMADNLVDVVTFASDLSAVSGIVYAEGSGIASNASAYSYSIAGGTAVSLSDMLAALEICTPEERESFVRESVADIQLPQEELVRTEAIEETVSDGFLGLGQKTVAVDYKFTPVSAFEEGGSVGITLADGTAIEIKLTAKGIEEASGLNVTISAADGQILPEEAEAASTELMGAEAAVAIEAVEAVEDQNDKNTEEDTGLLSAVKGFFTGKEAGTEEAGETVYKVFDIDLQNVDTEAYENGFRVNVTLPEGIYGSNFELYHIHDDVIEPLAVEIDEDVISEAAEVTVANGFKFETPGFSQFVLKYTVDFEYSVNGKMYQFSLLGGGFVSFTDLIEVLGIIGDTNIGENRDENGSKIAEITEENTTNEGVEENGVNAETNAPLTLGDVEVSNATRKFVADVASVEFSSPELVDVSKAENETTVGKIKDSRGLDCEYSAELTKEQIAKINAQTVEAGDWALISVRPFTSEETLTVTMKDGEQFVVKVTDAQIKKTVIDAKGDSWEITVTYGEDAQIPDGAELKVREILPEDEEYEQYYQQSMEKIGVVNTENEADATEEGLNASTADAIKDAVEELTDLIVSDNNEEETEVPATKVASDYTRVFDIEIWADDHKVEPAADVTVNIKLLDAPEKTGVTPQVVHFAKDGAELMALKERAENSKDEGIQFVSDEFSVYSVVYTVDFSYEVDGKIYRFTMQGADSVSLRALIDALHVYELVEKDKSDTSDSDSQFEAEVANADLAEQDDTQNAVLDSFMNDIKTVTFSNEQLLVPAKVEEDTTVGKIKTDLNLYPTYPLGLKQSEVLELNAKEYTAGDWALISMKAFDTEEKLTITMNTGESFDIIVTDAQDAVMNGDVVQTISNPAGTTIDLFDYWIVSQNLVGRDGWGDLNQSQGSAEAGDDKPLNGTGNNKGINSSPSDSEHGHALKFSPAWSGTVYNGNKIGTTGNAWQSVNLDMRDGLNSYTGDEYTWHWNCPNPFTGIVQNNLYNGYPILTNNQNIGTNGESLAYLFDPSVSHDGKASYDGVNQLLYVDKDGYYTYDSRDYAAAFNTGDRTFTLTEQTSSNSEIRGFWPFGTQNFWTGMHVNTQFSMPTGGQVLNPSGVLKPMQFEFSGDDDVWIYVDGILIGDAGGIHNRTEVDINFQTGLVSISNYTSPDNPGFRTAYLDDLFRTGLRDQGKAEAEIEEYITNNFDGHTFKAGTYHTFDFFYLERGGGESNLYIHYNLVSTADFSAHKAYYGGDETDLLRRDQFQFELIGLDGKYRSVINSETGNYELVQEDTTSKAIMPHAGGSGEGTVASPHYEDNVSTTLSNGDAVNSQIYITGVTEDGNINFGTAEISETDMHDADEGNPPVYKYIIREIVPDDAVNQDGITWASATDAQKAAGGFVKDQVTYDGTVYYMTGRVTSWTETNASGQEVVRHGISKTYYTDDTFTTARDDVNFASFENRFTPDFGSVDFTKVDGAGDPLQGAAFTLYKDETCTVPATDPDTEGHPVWTANSDSNGKVCFENIRVGTYYMKETTAPSQYALDETVYKVVIEDSKDNTKKSKITILGDEEEIAVTEIANAKTGKITVIKKWLNASGAETDGGSNSATVWLKRKDMVAEEGGSTGNHTVTVQMTVEDGGVQYGTPVTQTVTGDTVIIEWDDEWQRNFNWSLTVGNKSYEGWIGDEFVTTDNYSFEQISIDGRSRRLTIPHVQGDVSLTTKYWVGWLHSDNNHWNNLNNPVISGIGEEPNYVAEEDTAFNNEKHTQVLSGSTWSHTWSIGGTELSHDGFDYPAMDDNGKNYLYYVAELDAQGNAIEVGGSPLEGYVLQGYSANNNTGVSNQGVITVYNRVEGAETINVVIKKTDNAENSTNYLDGAVFKLMYRSDSSGTYTNVSSESVPQLNSESKFTVPTDGITLTGLVDGQYQLQEISPPSGYVITNSTPVTFTVSGGAITGTEGTITGVRYTAATETSNAEFIVPNPPGAALPNTGGPGRDLFYVLGCMLSVFAGMMLFKRYMIRMKKIKRRR